MNNLPFIAVVDDDPIYRLTIQKLLESTGVVGKILEFENGYPILRYLQDHLNDLPDIILLDINMPGMGGWDFLNAYEKILSTLSKRPKIYIVSSSSNDQDIAKAKTYTCVTNYITKPIKKDNLIKQLNLII